MNKLELELLPPRSGDDMKDSARTQGERKSACSFELGGGEREPFVEEGMRLCFHAAQFSCLRTQHWRTAHGAQGPAACCRNRLARTRGPRVPDVHKGSGTESYLVVKPGSPVGTPGLAPVKQPDPALDALDPNRVRLKLLDSPKAQEPRDAYRPYAPTSFVCSL